MMMMMMMMNLHDTFFLITHCDTCQTLCTIKHILLECKVFNDTRKHYFHANTTKDLFENVHMDNVLSFLKETGLYQKILTWLQSWKHNKLINWKQIIAE